MKQQFQEMMDEFRNCTQEEWHTKAYRFSQQQLQAHLQQDYFQFIQQVGQESRTRPQETALCLLAQPIPERNQRTMKEPGAGTERQDPPNPDIPVIVGPCWLHQPDNPDPRVAVEIGEVQAKMQLGSVCYWGMDYPPTGKRNRQDDVSRS